MRIKLISDIHLEMSSSFRRTKELNNHDYDVLVLAGDIGHLGSNELNHFIDKCCNEFNQVLYVTGNHEYYGGVDLNSSSLLNKLQDLYPNLTCGSKFTKGYQDVLFIGATFWRLTGNTEKDYALEHATWNDYRFIKYKGESFTPEDSSVLNVYHTKFIEEHLGKGDKKKVVITHHPPIDGLLQYFGMEELTKTLYVPFTRDADAWLFGHIHRSGTVYKYNKNKYYCNCVGYPREPNMYDHDMVIEV